MKLENNGFHSLEQVQGQYFSRMPVRRSNTAAAEGQSFREILEQATGAEKAVKFSKHAAGRLSTRNIELTDKQIERLNEGARKAEAKGIQDSLVIIDSLAFIVNVPSSTVVTAMEMREQQSEAQENIFTNIDGAVVI